MRSIAGVLLLFVALAGSAGCDPESLDRSACLRLVACGACLQDGPDRCATESDCVDAVVESSMAHCIEAAGADCAAVLECWGGARTDVIGGDANLPDAADGDPASKADPGADEGDAEAAGEVPATDTTADDVPVSDVLPVDAEDPGVGADVDVVADDTPGDATTDPGPQPGACASPPAATAGPSAPFPAPPQPGRGVDRFELPAYKTLRDALLADPNVAFVAAWSEEAHAFVVESGTGDARRSLSFRRTTSGSGAMEYEVLAGDPAEVLGGQDPAVLPSLDALFAAFTNPNDVDLASYGYGADDPRAGFLPADAQVRPRTLARIAATFDAPEAPDVLMDLQPWASGGGGTHGSSGLLQSRSTLIFSGRGVRQGAVLDAVPDLPDLAPTVLAALGAPTTGGIGPDGIYDDGLYLLRQDGRVLWDVLTAEPCDSPRHVVIVLLDGALASEVNHLALDASPEVDLPVLRALAAGGAVFRYGAVSNFPSVSAPGHMTSGTGLWSGHHGLIANAFYKRSTQTSLNPYALIEDPQDAILHPEKVLALYDEAVAPGIETLAQAAHRAFGAWDAATGTGAFVAVVNEATFVGSDWNTLDYFTGGASFAPPGRGDTAEFADSLAVTQIETLLQDEAYPIPTVLQVSFLSTDDAGEQDGPHSDALRAAMVTADGHISRIRELYAARGALDDALFVVVSDHGMELQDPSRTAHWKQAIASSGVKVVQPALQLIYLRTIEVQAEFEPLSRTIAVTVRNHDDGLSLAGADVACDACTMAGSTTDADGKATLTVGDGVAGVVLTASHASFNAQTIEVVTP